jgi:hypothetical protein
MDEIINITFSPNDLQIFNNWRVFYKVSTISDMTNATGDIIRSEFRDRRLVSTYISNTPMQWPSQLAPALSTYGIWLAGLKSAARMRDIL